MSSKKQGNVREAVAVFDTAETLEEAVDALQISGFSWAELSILAGEPAIKEKLGHLYTKTDELEDNPEVPTTAFISTEAIGDAEAALIGTPLYLAACTTAGIMTAVGGPLAVVIAASVAAGAAGALIGSILASMVGQHHADYLQDQLDRGGLLLWVRTRDAEHEALAKEILSEHSAHDVHIHG